MILSKTKNLDLYIFKNSDNKHQFYDDKNVAYVIEEWYVRYVIELKKYVIHGPILNKISVL